MTEWGHFSILSVIQVFTAVITAVGTIIRIIAPSPPVYLFKMERILYIQYVCPLIFLTIVHLIHFTLVGCVLLRTQGSAVWSVKWFGWAVLEKYASSSTGGQAIGPFRTDTVWIGTAWVWFCSSEGNWPGIVCLWTFGVFAWVGTQLKITWGCAVNTQSSVAPRTCDPQ